uniref:Secreted protein n=1 Tax=Anopheles merus TaxID=30066 RepID=A0A182VAX4_ANOME
MVTKFHLHALALIALCYTLHPALYSHDHDRTRASLFPLPDDLSGRVANFQPPGPSQLDGGLGNGAEHWPHQQVVARERKRSPITSAADPSSAIDSSDHVCLWRRLGDAVTDGFHFTF